MNRTLNPSDPTMLLPSLKPVSRGQKPSDVDKALTDERLQKDTVDMARDILEGRSAVKGQQRSRGGAVGEVVEVRLKGVPRQNLPHPGLYGRRVRLKREKREGKTTKMRSTL